MDQSGKPFKGTINKITKEDVHHAVNATKPLITGKHQGSTICGNVFVIYEILAQQFTHILNHTTTFVPPMLPRNQQLEDLLSMFSGLVGRGNRYLFPTFLLLKSHIMIC